LFALKFFVAQMIGNIFFNAAPLGFTGIKTILSAPWMLFYYLFWGLLSGSVSEEFGWRGYLLDKFLKKDGMVKASLIVGFVWGIWHLPLYFYPAQYQYQVWKINPLLGIGFILVPVSIVMDILLFIIIYKSKRFQQKLDKQVQQID